MVFLQCISNLCYLLLVASLYLQAQLACCYPLGIIVTLMTHADNITAQTGYNLAHANQLSRLVIQFHHKGIGSATLEQTTIDDTVQDEVVMALVDDSFRLTGK